MISKTKISQLAKKEELFLGNLTESKIDRERPLILLDH